MQDYTIEKIPCLSSLPHVADTPIEFRIPSRNGWFIDVHNLYHVVKLKIQKQDAANNWIAVPNGESCSPYCGFLWTMWKDLEVLMNHSVVWSSSQCYQPISYLSLLLNAPKGATRYCFDSRSLV